MCSYANAQQIITLPSTAPDPDNPGHYIYSREQLGAAVDTARDLVETGTSASIDLQGGRVFLNASISMQHSSSFPDAVLELRNGTVEQVPDNFNAELRFLRIGSANTAAPVVINNVDFLNANMDPPRSGGDPGGAIFHSSGHLEIRNSGFYGNLADGTGGAIWSGGSSLTVRNSQFEGNSAEEGGGAIASLGPLIIRNSNFLSNTIYNDPSLIGGGAILASNTLTIINSQFTKNGPQLAQDGIFRGAGPGGAIAIRGDRATISGSTFERNEGVNSGGALSIRSASGNGSVIVIRDSLFLENSASRTGGGGAIRADGETLNGITLDITNSTFVENTTEGAGGAIFLSPESSRLQVTASTFWNNQAQRAVGDALSDIGGNAIAARFDLPDTVQLNGSIIGSSMDFITGTNCVATSDGTTALAGNLASGINLATDDSCGPVESLDNAFANSMFAAGLADNGGQVLTLLPAAGSPAIDGVSAGTAGCPEQDARGIERPVFNDCDFGAVESTEDQVEPPPGPVDPAPLCDGFTATVYVGVDGVIVGGPLNGEAYAGTLRGTINNDVLVGTSGADVIAARGGNDRICSLNGEDTVFSGSGDDTVFAGADNDQIFGGPGRDVITGGRGDDVLWGSSGQDLINGGPGNDVLIGGADRDSLNGNNGIDTLHGGGGDDELSGGSGPDELNGDDGNDQLFGGSDRDVLNGGIGNDELFGENGRDQLNGGDGNDELFGDAGNDILDGGNDNDDLFGGPDDDIGVGGAGVDNCFGIETASRCVARD